jgi:hypothetical protein
MPISTNDVKETAEKIALKDQQGYLNSEQVNRIFPLVDKKVYQFYYKQYEATQNIVDSMSQFVESVNIPVDANGYMQFPADYVHRLEVGYVKAVNPVYTVYNSFGALQCDIQPRGNYALDSSSMVFYKSTGNAWVAVSPLSPEITYVPVNYMNSNEVFNTLASPIRKPNIQKNIARHEFDNNAIRVYPNNLGQVVFKYLRKPIEPFWNSTPVSTANGDFEQYNPAGSVDFDWNYENFQDLVDLTLFYLGMQVRETDLIKFAQMDQQDALINR